MIFFEYKKWLNKGVCFVPSRSFFVILVEQAWNRVVFIRMGQLDSPAWGPADRTPAPRESNG